MMSPSQQSALFYIFDVPSSLHYLFGVQCLFGSTSPTPQSVLCYSCDVSIHVYLFSVHMFACSNALIVALLLLGEFELMIFDIQMCGFIALMGNH